MGTYPAAQFIGGKMSDSEIRLGWLKVMYGANLVVSLPLGASVLVAPQAMRGLLRVPAGDPVSYLITSGAIPLAFGLAGAAGLRAPIRFSPVLAVQLVYKVLFLVAGAVPMMLSGSIPGYAIPILVISLFFAVGNGIALPYRYLLSGPAA